MEIYIKVEPLEWGKNGWYVDEIDSGCGSYINDGNDLFGDEDCRGSAAKSWSQAKCWAKTARMMCNWDCGKARITFWKISRGKPVKVQPPKKKRISSKSAR